MVVMILALIAGILGLLFIVASSAPRVHSTSFTLQPVSGYCTYHRIDVATSGSVTIAYGASPGIVEQYVMTAAQYQAWQSGYGISFIGEDQGSANTFTTTLPSGGTYYVLSCHGTGYDSTLQTGRHTMTITGLDPPPLYAGIGAIVIAVVLVVVALRLRARPARAQQVVAPGYTAYTPYTAYPPYTPSMMFPAAAPLPGPPVAPSTPVLQTLHVRLENASPVDESLQISLNGAPLATISLAAGQTAEVDLHPNASAPFGGALRVEVVSKAGSRAAQEVVPDATGRAEVTLRLG